MTPYEYIEEMGAGWNLGSCYDATWFGKVNINYRYWCCNGTWQYKVGSGSFANIIVLQEGWENISAMNRLRTFKFSFTPTANTVSITLKHPVLVDTTEILPLKISSITVGGTSVTLLNNALEFPAFSDGTSTLEVDLTTLFSDDALNKAVVINVRIDSENLVTKPTSDETELSRIRTYLITRVISQAGFADVNELVIKAVAAAGFKAIRIPIMWYGRCDVLDNQGHVHIDTEFLDHLATVLGWCHTEGLLVCINMHHDDNYRDNKYDGWLTTAQYVADPVVSVRYKSIWEQVADYFKDYGDWLSFASNNETLDDNEHWENPSKTNEYGLVQMQRDFYNVVRNSGGNNATRICIYPTYAAKHSCFNSQYENPNDSTDKGTWGFPYNDSYGIAEIHPYSSSVSDSRSIAKVAIAKGLPTIYGEYGTAGWTNMSNCQVTAYQVGFAKYYNMGTFIWDDDGGMRILNRRALTSTNYTSPNMWAGYMNNFIPSLIANTNLKETEILLNNRRQSAYVGDTVEIYLDTDKHVYISNEGSSNAAIIGGNSVVIGTTDVDNLLAISYEGEYNTIDITVDIPEHWTEPIGYNEESDWEHGAWSVLPQDGAKKLNNSPITSGYKALRYKSLIPISGLCPVVTWQNSGTRPLCVIEFDAGKNMLGTYPNTYTMVEKGTSYYLKPATRYIAVFIESQSQPEWISSRSLTVKYRDTTQTEEKDRTDSYIDSIVDYNNYYVSLYRTINVSGGMEYQLNAGTLDCSVYVREFNGNKLEAEYWIESGDIFTTNLFTKSIRLEIIVPNADIEDVISAMNGGLLRPTLAYTDYATHVPEYEEEFTPIPTSDSHGMVGIGNKILMYNGKCIKI